MALFRSCGCVFVRTTGCVVFTYEDGGGVDADFGYVVGEGGVVDDGRVVDVVEVFGGGAGVDRDDCDHFFNGDAVGCGLGLVLV